MAEKRAKICEQYDKEIRKAIIGAAEMRKCLDKIFDLAINERLK